MVTRSPKNSVLGAHSRTMGGHTELRGHVTKPSQMRHVCHLASWWLKHKKFDLFKPWHLRHPGSREASPVEMLTRTSMEDTQDERCEFSTALLHNNLQGSADRKKKKGNKARHKMGKMAEVSKTTVLMLDVWHSACCGCFHLLLLLFKLSPGSCDLQTDWGWGGALLFFKALIPSCSSSVTFPRERLYKCRTMNIIIQEIYLIALP